MANVLLLLDDSGLLLSLRGLRSHIIFRFAIRADSVNVNSFRWPIMNGMTTAAGCGFEVDRSCFIGNVSLKYVIFSQLFSFEKGQSTRQ